MGKVLKRIFNNGNGDTNPSIDNLVTKRHVSDLKDNTICFNNSFLPHAIQKNTFKITDLNEDPEVMLNYVTATEKEVYDQKQQLKETNQQGMMGQVRD